MVSHDDDYDGNVAKGPSNGNCSSETSSIPIRKVTSSLYLYAATSLPTTSVIVRQFETGVCNRNFITCTRNEEVDDLEESSEFLGANRGRRKGRRERIVWKSPGMEISRIPY